MKILKVLAMIVLASGLSQMAYADTTNMEKMHAGHDFGMKDADTNNDGVISREEFMAAHQARAEKMFTKMDTNNDGKIDQSERQAGKEMMMKHCKMKDHGMTGDKI